MLRVVLFGLPLIHLTNNKNKPFAAGVVAGTAATGAAFTFRGVLARRPPIGDLLPLLETLDIPALILTGDEDDPCIEPALLMKQHIPRAGLEVFPRTGHTINLEEPERFNRSVQDFLDAVDRGEWLARDAGSGAGFSGT